MPLASLGRIENRIFIPRDPVSYLHRYDAHEGREMVEILKRFSPPASDNARGYLFGCVYRVIGEHVDGIGPGGEAWYDVEEIHSQMKLMHHNKTRMVKGKDGVPVELTTGVSIAGIPADEMSAFISKVRAWANNFLGCYIPEPRSDAAEAMIAGWVR